MWNNTFSWNRFTDFEYFDKCNFTSQTDLSEVKFLSFPENLQIWSVVNPFFFSYKTALSETFRKYQNNNHKNQQNTFCIKVYSFIWEYYIHPFLTDKFPIIREFVYCLFGAFCYILIKLVLDFPRKSNNSYSTLQIQEQNTVLTKPSIWTIPKIHRTGFPWFDRLDPQWIFRKSCPCSHHFLLIFSIAWLILRWQMHPSGEFPPRCRQKAEGKHRPVAAIVSGKVFPPCCWHNHITYQIHYWTGPAAGQPLSV